MQIPYTNGSTCLVEQNGDKEVVDQKAFREFSTVVAKEEHCEDNNKKLVRRVCEGTAKHLDTAHHYDECRNATVMTTTKIQRVTRINTNHNNTLTLISASQSTLLYRDSEYTRAMAIKKHIISTETAHQ